jgi:hypothetical protein
MQAQLGGLPLEADEDLLGNLAAFGGESGRLSGQLQPLIFHFEPALFECGLAILGSRSMLACCALTALSAAKLSPWAASKLCSLARTSERLAFEKLALAVATGSGEPVRLHGLPQPPRPRA